MKDIFYFILAFFYSYVFFLFMKFIAIYVFIYLEKGIFPVSISDFYAPIFPSFLVIVVYILTAILIPKDKNKSGENKK
ncbi:hypothetical protein QJU96_00135 [Pasteurella skyensis]|uniref:Uncharacterized protein n=1 Tax=Phocoenobacter skyensis TaxID=97481 RepID=A0AAJ6NE53_9PAST|nr:hypothetical protein [Pasteurella skyensis]MDP8169702.1 hypothetical protein [Pasteurella skyensis]MDP8175130.1 hypothetical protein [Pasteurella skyensis]